MYRRFLIRTHRICSAKGQEQNGEWLTQRPVVLTKMEHMTSICRNLMLLSSLLFLWTNLNADPHCPITVLAQYLYYVIGDKWIEMPNEHYTIDQVAFCRFQIPYTEWMQKELYTDLQEYNHSKLKNKGYWTPYIKRQRKIKCRYIWRCSWFKI